MKTVFKTIMVEEGVRQDWICLPLNGDVYTLYIHSWISYEFCGPSNQGPTTTNLGADLSAADET